MHRRSSELLWSHLLHECHLQQLLGAVKNYFLLGRGELFHHLLEELRPYMGSCPTPTLDLQALLVASSTGGQLDPYFDRLKLEFSSPPATTGEQPLGCTYLSMGLLYGDSVL